MTTNNKPYILNLSLLPLVVLIAIILGAGYLLVEGDIKLPKIGKDGTEIRRLEDFPTVVNTNTITEKQRVIIKSQEELNTFFNRIDPSGLLVLKENINFDREYIIAVATETVKTNGYKIKIRKAYHDESDATLKLAIVETRPGDTCLVDNQPNVAVDLVAISKTDLNIEFERIKEVDECQ